MELLTVSNPKVAKGIALGFHTAILHLAPSDLSGRDLCPFASPACRLACLNTAGRGGIIKKGESTNKIQLARLRRSRWFLDDRAGFVDALARDIAAHVRACERLGVKPAVRLNGTSDIPWERVAPSLFAQFPGVVFYDYTKAEHRLSERLPSNYSLTFSRSETNGAALLRLPTTANVAVVFAGGLPDTFAGRRVINGDAHDLRFLDPQGVIVGLLAKGKAKKDTSGFVVRVHTGACFPHSLANAGRIPAVLV